MVMIPPEHGVGNRPTPDDFGVDLDKAKQKKARHERLEQSIDILGSCVIVTSVIAWCGFWIVGLINSSQRSADDFGMAFFAGWLGSAILGHFWKYFFGILGVILEEMHSKNPARIALKRYESAQQEYKRQELEEKVRGLRQIHEEESQRERQRREKKWHRERQKREEELRKKRQQREHWFSLSGHEFEQSMAELFQKSGMEVERTSGSDDDGVDLFLNADPDKIAVQCKAHKKPLSPAVAREFYGALKDKNCARGILIGLGGFTTRTREFAARNQIELWDVNDVIRFAEDKVPMPSGHDG